jgi:FtsH-binding integral membrane protein
MQRSNSPQVNFVIIQLAMILGVLIFAGVAWYMHSQQRIPPCGLPAGLQYALPIVCILALSAIVFVKRLRAPMTQNQQFQTVTLIGWAAGEGAALMGVLYYWCTDNPTWTVTGILVMLFGAVMLPAKLPQP